MMKTKKKAAKFKETITMKGTTKTKKKVAIQRDNQQKGNGRVHGDDH
jgi:hypothetical protein